MSATTREYSRAYREANKEKINASKRVYREANKEKASEQSRKWRYGTCGSDLFEKQKGACAICRAELSPSNPHNRHLDHCHITGAVRGWLCRKCNTGLGNFNDNAQLLKAAASYLGVGE